MTSQTSALPSRRRLWLAAIKPPMYTVAVIPISVGSAAAYGVSGQGSLPIFALFLLAAIAIIAWINLSNDVFDADTGIDVNKAHSVVNLTGNRRLVFWLSNAFLVLGLGGVLAITALQRDFTVLGLILVCCALGYSYQGPPFRLGYLGLGEIICFLTFGPGAVSAAYYSQSQSLSPALLFPALFVGLSTSIILFCSHFHQVEDDLAAGKRSPIVRLGTARGAAVLIAALILLFLLPVGAVLLGLAPVTALLTLLSLPFALQLGQKIQRERDKPALVSNSKFIAVNLHFFSGLLLALGYLFA
ncbi:MAG: 2-carboxy-1,4-naphthoquinone phytyltransferase [Cyanobacteriota bacterium]|jgi:1,4-dihydroxy-2-naphthoate phytyltransferase